MIVYICTKFHENILKRIKVMERTPKANGWTEDGHPDRWMDGRHNIIRLVFDGRIKKLTNMKDPLCNST